MSDRVKVTLGDPYEDPGLSWPRVPKDLVEFLERHYPDRWPKSSEGIEEIRFKAGQRSLVNTLREVHRRQTERSP